MRAALFETCYLHVVPANAGTHSHRCLLLEQSRLAAAFNHYGRGVWVPAPCATAHSAGTTWSYIPHHCFEKIPTRLVAPLAWPSSALISSSRVMPSFSAAGSRSVAIKVRM